jgi:transketolase
LTPGWESQLPIFRTQDGSIATRAASGKVLNALSSILPNLLGGSADLAPSNNTLLQGIKDFTKDSPEGRNLHFGIREHAMGAILNGLALHGGIIPYGGTFLTFSDYMRPSVRLAAMMHLQVIYVWTHDSVWLGEDGPTHQPIEHLASLRAIPHLIVIRPADANETALAWRIALANRQGPTALILTRQNLPVLEQAIRQVSETVGRGAYILADSFGIPQVILIATGSEVHLALQVKEKLAANQGIRARVVSMPSWELFEEQSLDYRESVLLPQCRARVSIEAGVSQGWHKYVGDQGLIISIDRFGASAPASDLSAYFKFTIEDIVEKVLRLLADN